MSHNFWWKMDGKKEKEQKDKEQECPTSPQSCHFDSWERPSDSIKSPRDLEQEHEWNMASRAQNGQGSSSDWKNASGKMHSQLSKAELNALFGHYATDGTTNDDYLELLALHCPENVPIPDDWPPHKFDTDKLYHSYKSEADRAAEGYKNYDSEGSNHSEYSKDMPESVKNHVWDDSEAAGYEKWDSESSNHSENSKESPKTEYGKLSPEAKLATYPGAEYDLDGYESSDSPYPVDEKISSESEPEAPISSKPRFQNYITPPRATVAVEGNKGIESKSRFCNFFNRNEAYRTAEIAKIEVQNGGWDDSEAPGYENWDSEGSNQSETDKKARTQPICSESEKSESSASKYTLSDDNSEEIQRNTVSTIATVTEIDKELDALLLLEKMLLGQVEETRAKIEKLRLAKKNDTSQPPGTPKTLPYKAKLPSKEIHDTSQPVKQPEIPKMVKTAPYKAKIPSKEKTNDIWDSPKTPKHQNWDSEGPNHSETVKESPKSTYDTSQPVKPTETLKAPKPTPYKAKLPAKEPELPKTHIGPYVDQESFWGPPQAGSAEGSDWRVKVPQENWVENPFHLDKMDKKDSKYFKNYQTETDKTDKTDKLPPKPMVIMKEESSSSSLQLAEQLEKQRRAVADKFQHEWKSNRFSQFYTPNGPKKLFKLAKHREYLTMAKVLKQYTHTEAVEFAATSWFWTGPPGPKLETKTTTTTASASESLESEDVKLPTFDDQDGVRAYYRVITEKDERYILMACHANVHAFHRADLRFIEVNHRTMVKGLETKSPVGRMYLGDIVAVTEMARVAKNEHLYQKNLKKISQDSFCCWQVKTMTVLRRETITNLEFSFLPNGMGVAKGFDEAMDVLLGPRQTATMDKLFIGHAFIPQKIEMNYCQGFEKRFKNTIILHASEIPSYPHASGTIFDFREDEATNRIFEVGTRAFAESEFDLDLDTGKFDKENVVETCVLMGYAAANAMFNGRFDCRAFPIEKPVRDGTQILRFNIENPKFQPTLGRWNTNNKINIVGPECETSGTIESVIEQPGNRISIVARLARGVPRQLEFSSQYLVFQREPPDNTVLKEDFFKIMDPKSNARRIIETLYGGKPITMDTPINSQQFVFPGTPEIALNEFQNEYVSMILARTPMVLGSSPFGCGKSMTIVTAAFEVHKRNLEESMLVNEKQQLLITQSNFASVNLIDIAKKANPSVKFVRYVSEKCWKELADGARTDYDTPKLMEKVFSQWATDPRDSQHQKTRHLNNNHFMAMINYLIDNRHMGGAEFQGMARQLYKSNYGQKALPKGRLNQRELLDAFFTLYKPDIIMVTADSSLALLNLNVLKDVVTIQIDEASQLPEYTLFSLLVSFPNANYGLIGDIHQLPPYCVDELRGKLRDFGIGNTMERAVQNTLFPKSILRYVYRCHPKITQLLSELFYDSELLSGVTEEMRSQFVRKSKIWPNPTYPMIIVDNTEPAYRMGTSYGNRAEATVVRQIVKAITNSSGYSIPPEDVGVISFYSSQTSVLTEALRGSGVKCGTVDAFQGSEREVIILCCTSERLSEFMQLPNRLNVAMSRARQATIIIGNVDGLRRAKYWSQVVNRVEEHRNLVDTNQYPFCP